jgi:nucleoside-diphosphate-sugar epimerase
LIDMLKKIMLTGATGFVGQALIKKIVADKQFLLTIAVRKAIPCEVFDQSIRVFSYEDISATTDWQTALKGYQTVIHTAARVHVMKERACNSLAEFRAINVFGTMNLAQQAADAGVNCFIFISSIKVNGESTTINKPFTPNDKPNPQDAYAQSKYEAEQALMALAQQTNMAVVIIRPPLVYGLGMKGNLQRLVYCLNYKIPLPLGAIDNLRSLVSIDNLTSLIMCCIDNSNAANQIFLVSDGNDLSTTALLKKIGQALGKPANLLPLPVGLLRFLAGVIGRQDIIQRVCGSLQVDISKTCSMLNWQPNTNIDMEFIKLDKKYKSSYV